jgi:hypothetical protein
MLASETHLFPWALHTCKVVNAVPSIAHSFSHPAAPLKAEKATPLDRDSADKRAYLHMALAPPAALAHDVAHLIWGFPLGNVIQQVGALVVALLQLHSKSVVLSNGVLQKKEESSS